MNMEKTVTTEVENRLLVRVVTVAMMSLPTTLANGVMGIGIRVESIDRPAETLKSMDDLRHSKPLSS
jgi:hypothetical protein